MSLDDVSKLIALIPDREIRITEKNGAYYVKVCPVGGCTDCPDPNNPDCP